MASPSSHFRLTPEPLDAPGDRRPQTKGLATEAARKDVEHEASASAPSPSGAEELTDTLALVDDVAATGSVNASFDTEALVGARFHRAVVLTSGKLVAEFVFENPKLPQIVLDEADVYATAVFLPKLGDELRAAMHALEQIRKEVAPK